MVLADGNYKRKTIHSTKIKPKEVVKNVNISPRVNGSYSPEISVPVAMLIYNWGQIIRNFPWALCLTGKNVFVKGNIKRKSIVYTLTEFSEPKRLT